MATTLSSASIDRFLESLCENGHGDNTIRAYRADLRGLLTWLESQEAGELEPLTAKYLNAHRASWAPKTTRRKLGTFRTWARWAGYPAFLPLYKGPTPERAIPHPIEDGIEAVVAMVEACGGNRQRRALVALCGLCGLRVHEALAVRPRDVDVVHKTVTVRGKGDKARTVPVSGKAWAEILPVVVTTLATGDDTAPLVGIKDRWARQLLTKLATQAGIEHRVSSHDLRATLATAAYEHTHDLRAVQELLGHASSTTTEVYTGVSKAAMRRAVEVA